jgi:hypothetical protein
MTNIISGETDIGLFFSAPPKKTRIGRLAMFTTVGREYWTQNICEFENVTVRGEGMMERARGEQDALCTIASPPSPHHDWLASNVCICNDQGSSKISCGRYKW